MKKLIIIIIILILLGVIGFLGYRLVFRKKSAQKGGQMISKKKELVNQLALEKRPYVTLTSREDGREISMTIADLKNGEEKAEYELEYQTGTMLQSAFGRINFLEEKPPVTKKLLLGSCSAGGKCSYDENVTGGSLTLYFEGKESYGLKADFTFNKMKDKEGSFSSRDVKTILEIGKKSMPDDSFVIVASTMGLPDKVEGEVLAGPVGFFASTSVDLKDKVTLTFKGISSQGDFKVLGWDGSDWQEYKAEKTELEITTQVDRLGTFVLISE